MTNQRTIRTAFTLVEVLVVITILSILTAVAIPRLRVINKERGIREASRVVASSFAQASQRAVTDGVSGVLLRRNPNFADANGYSFAVQSLSLLRAVPDYRGDQATDTASDAGGNIVNIPYPIEQDDLGIIKAGDEISFADSTLRYSIMSVTPLPASGPPFTTLDLTLDLTGSKSYLPNPNDVLTPTTATPAVLLGYTVFRLPRPLRSSETDLPDGFTIDLRFMGFTMIDSGLDPFDPGDPQSTNSTFGPRITQVLETHPRVVLGTGPFEVVNFVQSDIAILFNNDGGVDRIVLLAEDMAGNEVIFERDLVDNLRLLVTEVSVETEDVDYLTNPSKNPLNRSDHLWVSVSRSSGSANVGHNAVPAVSPSIQDLTDLYNGMDADRTTFNGVLTTARGDSDISVAAQ